MLISTVLPETLNVLPAPIKFNAVRTPTATFNPPDCIPIPYIPLLAVITPTESTFVTSSYVNVPPIDKFPDTVKLSKGPSNFVAVMIPDECIL